MQPLFRFRIFHLLIAIAIVGACLWIATQAGMEKANVKILEASGLSFFGPDGSFDNWGSSFGKVRFQFLEPSEFDDQFVNVFINSSKPIQSGPMEGREFKFRYRKRRVLWLQPQDLTQTAIREIGLEPEMVEEVIIEVIPSDMAN